jgi:lipopolysaccharide transport system ATP-binding protein
MNDNVIEVRDLSKKYRLGTVNHGMLFKDLQSWFARLRGKEDPNAKIGEGQKRIAGDEFWALRDVSFDVQRGDIVGIIGRNGAGKSTLLKLISRLTKPTSGSITIKGRVASLLEVGTGFHPELSGRDNVYLNGAILGMTKAEIRRKFDEIVAFSGVEDFIDTPVKRYSSGMYVRLAFAVAAHLESEILIVDEVLAVGDAEFQKKCLGKMEAVSKGQGRTVLFVSHQMEAISRLCHILIYMNQGKVQEIGTTEKILSLYLDQNEKSHSDYLNLEEYNIRASSEVGERMRFQELKLLKTLDRSNAIYWDQPLALTLKFTIKESVENFSLGITVATLGNINIFTANNMNTGFGKLDQGEYLVEMQVEHQLRPGLYTVHLGARDNGATIWWHTEVFNFSVLSNANYPANNFGLVLCKSKLTLKSVRPA